MAGRTFHGVILFILFMILYIQQAFTWAIHDRISLTGLSNARTLDI